MKLLVFGRTGQVGHEILRRRPADMDVLGLGRAEVDVGSDREAVVAAIRGGGWDVVVNATAHTAVDKAESEPELAMAINRDGPAWMAAACADLGIPLIHLSTDYVFDGSKAGAYVEEDPVRPLGAYGVSKEAGERAVRDALPRHVILRTSWVFGAHGRNFVKTMLRLGEERPELGIVADQVGCPTAAADIADTVLAIARRVAGSPANALEGGAPWGTYHYSGAPCTSWHGFATAIFDLRREITGAAPPALRAISTSDYPTPARRPANSELDCSKLRARFGIGPADWRASLAEVLNELLTARETQR